MCGIIAYIGNENSFNKCLCGLKQSQNAPCKTIYAA